MKRIWVLALTVLSGCILDSAEPEQDPSGPGGNPDQAVIDQTRDTVKSTLEAMVPGIIDGIDSELINNPLFQDGIHLDSRTFLIRQNASAFQVDEEEVRGDLLYFLDQILGRGVVNRSERSVTFRPKDELCTEILAPNDPGACIATLGKLRIKISLRDAGGVGVGLSYDSLPMLSMILSEGYFSLNVSVAELVPVLNSAFRTVEAIDGSSLPVFTGVPVGRVEFEVVQTTQGLAEGWLQVSESISLHLENPSIDIEVGESLKLVQFQIDRTHKTAMLEVNAPWFHLGWEERPEDVFGTLSSEGFSGKLMFDNANRTLTSEDIQTHSGGVHFTGSDGSEIHVDLGKLSATIDYGGEYPSLALLNAFEWVIEFQAGSHYIDKTGLIAVGTHGSASLVGIGDDLVQVTSGVFYAHGEGDFDGDWVATPPSCFTIGDVEAGLPLTLNTTCE